MVPPFSAEQFFDVFVAYNRAVWPAQIVLVGAAILCLVLALLRRPWNGKAVACILATLWAWMAVVYHWVFFSEINPAARIFGALFLLETGALLWVGLRKRHLQFEPSRDVFGAAGAVLIAYALILYPWAGTALGHRYPAQPTFGLPCPTSIFTVGMLAWAKPRVPLLLFVVPLVWSVIGTTAVFYFGVLEDAMLPVATVSAATLVAIKNRQVSTGL